jgi:hypothetical protein
MTPPAGALFSVPKIVGASKAGLPTKAQLSWFEGPGFSDALAARSSNA